jgi:hypothetical protein
MEFFNIGHEHQSAAAQGSAVEKGGGTAVEVRPSPSRALVAGRSRDSIPGAAYALASDDDPDEFERF